MVQVKEHLKAWNDIRPTLTFNKDSFAQLNLNDYSNFDPFKSKILTGQKPVQLIKLCEFGLKDKFKLLYRASEHGFHSSQFHSKCDYIPNTLTILKPKGTEFIFGGFTKAIWDGSGGHKSDPDAFLFSLTNNDNKQCKIKVDVSMPFIVILRMVQHLALVILAFVLMQIQLIKVFRIYVFCTNILNMIIGQMKLNHF